MFISHSVRLFSCPVEAEMKACSHHIPCRRMRGDAHTTCANAPYTACRVCTPGNTRPIIARGAVSRPVRGGVCGVLYLRQPLTVSRAHLAARCGLAQRLAADQSAPMDRSYPGRHMHSSVATIIVQRSIRPADSLSAW